MSTSYYIFKTNNKTGETTHICNGSHDSVEDCNRHWRCYLYGFMDGAIEIVGGCNFDLSEGTHPNSFRFAAGEKDVEYFMLLDEEGQELIAEICKNGGRKSPISEKL